MKRETAAAGAFLAICLLGAFFMFVVALYHNINEELKREQERRASNRANNAVVLSGLAQQAHADTELAKKGKMRVGMITEQCRIAWGESDHINHTTDARGENKQWVYGGGHYLYFDDEVLSSIQGIGRPESAPAEVTLSAAPVTHFAVATATPTVTQVRNPDIVTVTKPISIAVRYGQRGCCRGNKAPLCLARLV